MNRRERQRGMRTSMGDVPMKRLVVLLHCYISQSSHERKVYEDALPCRTHVGDRQALALARGEWCGRVLVQQRPRRRLNRFHEANALGLKRTGTILVWETWLRIAHFERTYCTLENNEACVWIELRMKKNGRSNTLSSVQESDNDPFYFILFFMNFEEIVRTNRAKASRHSGRSICGDRKQSSARSLSKLRFVPACTLPRLVA